MNPARFDYCLLASVLDISKIKLQLLNRIDLLEMWTHLLTHEIHWQHSPTFHLWLSFWSRFLSPDLGHGLLTSLPASHSQTELRDNYQNKNSKALKVSHRKFNFFGSWHRPSETFVPFICIPWCLFPICFICETHKTSCSTLCRGALNF